MKTKGQVTREIEDLTKEHDNLFRKGAQYSKDDARRGREIKKRIPFLRTAILTIESGQTADFLAKQKADNLALIWKSNELKTEATIDNAKQGRDGIFANPKEQKRSLDYAFKGINKIYEPSQRRKQNVLINYLLNE